jgi:ubiquinone/menaquinone biosynthesis C-methylase UbiE
MTHAHGGVRPANDPERRRWQDPEAILETIGLKAGDVFVDVGCGGGFFALPAARIVGPKGKVYGCDVNPDSIAALKKQAAKEDLKNLDAAAAKAEAYLPGKEMADYVFYGIALHDFQDQAKVLANARRILKPSGKLINLDWKKEDVPFGPPSSIKFSIEKASKLIEAAGFKIVSVEDSGPYHYLITAKPA